MDVALLGLGLIGGSIARALTAAPDRTAWRVRAWTPSGEGPRRAADDGAVATAATTREEAVAGADLIVLAAPPTLILEQLEWIAGPGRAVASAGAVITDVASTKAAIVGRARELGLRFVGGHPMAGRETSGYDASIPDLFQDRPWVVCPPDDDVGALVAVETLAVACRARPVRLAAAEHDQAVAAISHLPLVLAAALVEAVTGGGTATRADWPAARALAASGWRDMTRLARGDVAMGTGIAATNALPLAQRIRDVQAVLDGWLADLEAAGGPDAPGIAARLRRARERLLESDEVGPEAPR